MKKRCFVLSCAILLAMAFLTSCGGNSVIYANTKMDETGAYEQFTPGARWYDTDGNLIQAHGGQVQTMPVPLSDGSVKEMYVWVGEDKSNGHFGNCVAMYYSSDLYNWTFGGDVLRSIETEEQMQTEQYFIDLYADYTKEEKQNVFHCINTDTVIERPKMLYNEKTGKYVIWFHSDDKTEQNSYPYDVGMSGVAVADSPFGPFRFINRYRLNECPSGQLDCYPTSKGEARDMNLFQDDDGTAYITYTSENNKTLYISKLNEEYTYLSADPKDAVYKEDYIRIFPGAMREAPVLIKAENGRYYLMSSSTTGWLSNAARVWSADAIFGTWINDGNPCIGEGGSITFDTQSTCLFRARNGQWIYYGDRWNGRELTDSRYIWLPVTFVEDKLTIRWESRWKWED